MWKDSIRNSVVIFQPNILRIVGFYVRHSAIKENCPSSNEHETPKVKKNAMLLDPLDGSKVGGCELYEVT